MNFEVYHFKIGNVECIAISDGVFKYKPPTFSPPTTFLFANAPKERVEDVLRKYHLQPEKWTEWISTYTCLMINTGKMKVLVDTGAGSLDSNTGRLLQNLRGNGIPPEDIDIVILTHGHPDHIGGNIIEGKSAFPNARFVMWKDEWNFWTSKPVELKAEDHVKELLIKVASENLLPIKDQLTLIDDETEILPGIRPILVPGHTPGHMALSVSSNGDRLLCIADAVLHPIHVEQPSWHAIVDFSSEQVEDTRRRLFSQAVKDEALIFAFHFPFPGLGHIILSGEKWRWQPIK